MFSNGGIAKIYTERKMVSEMVNVPAKTKDRLVSGLKKFQPIVRKAKDKDINESDTVTIIADMLEGVFGFDKYTEITSEYAVKKTFCDLAIEVDGKLTLLIEAKAAGLTLKDDYVRQAVDYGANSGIEWIVLTNGVCWKVFKVLFTRPIEKELIYEFDFTELSAKKQSDIEMLYYLTKESIAKSSSNLLSEFAAQRQVLNHFFIGQLLITTPILDALRKQIKKMAPDTKVSAEEIKDILALTVIKRDVFEGDKSDDAKKRIQKYEKALAKKRTAKSAPQDVEE